MFRFTKKKKYVGKVEVKMSIHACIDLKFKWIFLKNDKFSKIWHQFKVCLWWHKAIELRIYWQKICGAQDSFCNKIFLRVWYRRKQITFSKKCHEKTIKFIFCDNPQMMRHHLTYSCNLMKTIISFSCNQNPTPSI